MKRQDQNVVAFTAYVANNPELRTTRTDRSVTTVRAAIGRRPVNEEDRGAVYIDVEVWDGQAKACATYLTKGRRISVSGRLEHEEKSERRPQRNYIVADTVGFLDPPPASGDAADEPAEDPAPAAAA